jgi:hypothetical protein
MSAYVSIGVRHPLDYDTGVLCSLPPLPLYTYAFLYLEVRRHCIF